MGRLVQNNLENHLNAQDQVQERDHGEIIAHLVDDSPTTNQRMGFNLVLQLQNHIQQNFKPAPSQQVRK